MPYRDTTKKQAYDDFLRQRHAERAAHGLCTRCGRVPPEPALKVCGGCAEKRRAAERARRARAGDQGKPYAGRDPERCRRADRDSDGRRRRERQEAGLCTSCGRRRPSGNASVCEPCRAARRNLDRRRYAARRAAGRCVRCSEPAPAGLSRCGRCLTLEKQRVSAERKSAGDKRRYARRRAQRRCVDCGIDTDGSARCPRCAERSNVRSPQRHLVPLWPPQITVVDLETGTELGSFETEAEAAACLVFAGLRSDQVEFRSDAPLMAIAAAP
ncbi:MAG: hypothetical protein OXI20_12175 [Rhodospirillales bacterium]|nr:hypothetical protein [Rhodospirillales bacterium]